MKNYAKYLLTGAIVAIAVIVVLVKYWDYVTNPWTRDGQVRAEVIQLTPRVSGPIVDLPIEDNQFVKAGDLLFEIDPRTYEVSLARARAQLDQTGSGVQALEKQVEAARATVQVSRASIQQVEASIKELDAQIETNRAEYERQKELLPRRSTSQKAVDQARTAYEVSLEQRNGALASLAQAEASVRQAEATLAEARAKLGALGESNAQVRAALAAVRQAELNLEFTKVKAPVDGYVTNLNLRIGSHAVANQPALALIDVASYWVHGYFRENHIADVRAGNRAIVTLMTYPDTPLEGRVESIGWGISQQDGSTGFELLPAIRPTFEWIRLAQRVPVRIHLNVVPEEIALRVGTPASVLVMTGTGTSGQVSDKAVPAAPRALQ
jgi:multidrug resistance efflux pump